MRTLKWPQVECNGLKKSINCNLNSLEYLISCSIDVRPRAQCARPFFGSTPNTWIYYCIGRQIDSICCSPFNLFFSSFSLDMFYRWSHSSHIHCSTCNAMQVASLHTGTIHLNNDKITCRLSHLTQPYLFSPTFGSRAQGRAVLVATIPKRSHR